MIELGIGHHYLMRDNAEEGANIVGMIKASATSRWRSLHRMRRAGTDAVNQYCESKAIEKLLKENPAARQAWVKRQLEMELVDRELSESERDQRPASTPEPAAVGK
jgi:hypothetical protein